jgi:hypothetical protein
MCGRYRLSRRKQFVEEYFESVSEESVWTLCFNIAPTQPVEGARRCTVADALGAHSMIGETKHPSWVVPDLLNPHDARLMRCYPVEHPAQQRGQRRRKNAPLR